MPTLDPPTDTHPHARCVRQAVEATLGMFFQDAPSYTGSEERAIPGNHIVGIIALTGGCSNSLLLCLPRDTAVAVAASFAGFEIAFDSDDMGDVVGELCNILAGSVAAHMEGIGVRADLSLPTVIRGKDMSIPLSDGVQRVSMHYASPCGDFSVTLAIGDANPGPNPARNL